MPQVVGGGRCYAADLPNARASVGNESGGGAGFTLRGDRSGRASLNLFGSGLFWNYECDHAVVEGVVVCVLQVNLHFVRAGEKTHEDDWIAARIGPHP